MIRGSNSAESVFVVQRTLRLLNLLTGRQPERLDGMERHGPANHRNVEVPDQGGGGCRGDERCVSVRNGLVSANMRVPSHAVPHPKGVTAHGSPVEYIVTNLHQDPGENGAGDQGCEARPRMAFSYTGALGTCRSALRSNGAPAVVS